VEKDFLLRQWRVYPALNRMESGTKGVSLEPRVMDLLVYLHKHGGQVIPKDQIIRDVWGGVCVTEQAVTYTITEMRRALGDDAHSPTFIRTVPKRGYQLMGCVSETGAENHDPTDQTMGKSGMIGLAPFSDC